MYVCIDRKIWLNKEKVGTFWNGSGIRIQKLNIHAETMGQAQNAH